MGIPCQTAIRFARAPGQNGSIMRIPTDLKTDRISFKSIGEAILEALNLERGIGFTVKELIVRPKEMLEDFLFNDRSKYTKPLTLLLLVVAGATFVSLKVLPLDQALIDAVREDKLMQQIPESLRGIFVQIPVLLQQYFNIFFMSSLPAVSLATYLIFQDARLNLAEHFIINIYVFCIQTLIFIVFMPLFLLREWTVGIHIVALFFYTVFAYTKIFEQAWGSGLLKSVGVYMMSQVFISFMIGILLFFVWVLA